MGLIYRVCHGGVRHWLDRGDGIDLCGRVMGARDWIGVMELICEGMPWRSATLARSVRWIDLLGRAMGACDAGWIGVMGLIHGGGPNDKVLYSC